jgi:serine/threonine-protein kinase
VTELPLGARPVDAIGPGTRLREWEIVRFVGRGSYGVVFEARRSSWLDEQPRALKIFDPIVSSAARSALLDEFTTLTQVHNPHLLMGIDAFDLVEAPYAGCVVFVLELADEDLAHRVARSGPLPPGEAARVVAQVADGLAALHGEGRIHGDVKPENILRVGDRWALGDFGVTSVLEGSYAVTRGATVDFRPPEAAQAPAGGRQHRSADVWALGVSLHVAATGRHPFPGPDPIMRYAAVVRGDRALVPGLDPTLAAVIDDACLVTDPHGRLTAAALAERLRAVADRWGGTAPPPGPTPRAVDLSAPTAPAADGGDHGGAQPAPTVPDGAGGVPVGVSSAPTVPDGVGKSSAPTVPDGAGGVPVGVSSAPTVPDGMGVSSAPTVPDGVGAPSAPTVPDHAVREPTVPFAPAVGRPGGPHGIAGPDLPLLPPFGPTGGPVAVAVGSGAATGGPAAAVLPAASAAVATAVMTQVVAVACGAVLDDVGARRVAYTVLSLAVLVVAAGVRSRRARSAGAGPDGHRARRAGHTGWVATAAVAAWVVSTIALMV